MFVLYHTQQLWLTIGMGIIQSQACPHRRSIMTPTSTYLAVAKLTQLGLPKVQHIRLVPGCLEQMIGERMCIKFVCRSSVSTRYSHAMLCMYYL